MVWIVYPTLALLGLAVYLHPKGRAYRSYALILLAASLLAGGVAFIERGEGEAQTEYMERKLPGEGENLENFELSAEGIGEGYPFTVEAEEQKLTEEERGKLFAKAEEELEERILGENDSADHITLDLNVPEALQEGLVAVSLRFDNYDVLDSKGRVLWENFKEQEYLIQVTAELACQEEERIHEFYVRLTNEEMSEEQRLFLQLSKQLQAENEREGQETLHLPVKVNGRRIRWKAAVSPLHYRILLLGGLGVVLLYVYHRNAKTKAKESRIAELKRDYPSIVGQLSLLTAAGMTVGLAWSKIAEAYLRRKEDGDEKERPGYEEMLCALREIQDGVGENRAYEHFGNRCDLPAYRKLASLLTQNIRKGGQGMQKLLDAEAAEAFLQRKLRAKQLGEEAGTKLLLPMGLMLILVFVILLVPATISMS